MLLRKSKPAARAGAQSARRRKRTEKTRRRWGVMDRMRDKGGWELCSVLRDLGGAGDKSDVKWTLTSARSVRVSGTPNKCQTQKG